MDGSHALPLNMSGGIMAFRVTWGKCAYFLDMSNEIFRGKATMEFPLNYISKI